MNRKPELPVEIEKALRRYLEIQAEEQRLKEEKNDLRERIGEHMAGLEMKYWYPKIDGQALKVRYRETTAIEYNESLLHDRLGDRYPAILAPDLRKIRLHLDKLESLFTPVLSLIGSPVPGKSSGCHRERHREQGILRRRLQENRKALCRCGENVGWRHRRHHR